MFRSSHRRLALRLAAFASVSLVALPAAPAMAGLLPTLSGTSSGAAGAVKPYWGDISPFWGDLSPFWGDISPFWGDISPFWGDISPFWGDISPFWGDISPFDTKNAPAFGKVGEFWKGEGKVFDATFASWNALDGAKKPNYAPVANQLTGVMNDARTFWGASVKAQTGKSFDDAFAKPLLAKYGIDLAKPDTLASMDKVERAQFFLELYDGLMNYTGTDHVDHWMGTVNWTPALTQMATNGYSGVGSTIGLLDQTAVGDKTLAGSIVKSDGVSGFTNGHGVAVASLLVAPHDGKGIMGLSPTSKVVAYNPFDASGTANWDDITKGIQKLKAEGANVVNASLGVPGVTFDQGWNNVFANLATTLTLKNTVFVMAAGNEGATQTKNIDWSLLNPGFIVVGSVGLDGQISSFSNRPGTACLTPVLGICLGDKLMNHFIVAPGELILVSDGKGGVIRGSGTSFAAPLVSGAVALVQDRWPWLVNSPTVVTDIILNSAKDLGAPGVDPVYGHGQLDIGAAMSPLSFDSLVWYSVVGGKSTMQTQKAVLSTIKTGSQQTWDAQGAYFYAFEPLGLLGLVQRDFAIPLSNKLVGQNLTTFNGSEEQFQGYLTARMGDWAATKKGLASDGPNRFSTVSAQMPNSWGADMTLTVAPRSKRQGFVDEGPDYQSNLRMQGERSSFTVGFGDGAPALANIGGAGTGFVQAADFDSERGGANPLLGLASGGAFAGMNYGLSDRLQVSAGVLHRADVRDKQMIPALGADNSGARTYQADATLMSLAYKVTNSVTLTGGYTRLREGSGLLGVQSLDPADFAKGSTTDGLSLGMNWAVSPNLAVMATGTMGHTQAEGGQTLAVDAAGITSSAYELGIMRTNLFRGGDRLQLSVSQPMHVERGHLNVTTVQVIDRQTGEIGQVTQSLDISGKRKVAGEALYSLPLTSGDVTLFGRVESPNADQKSQTYMAGARYRVQF